MDERKVRRKLKDDAAQAMARWGKEVADAQRKQDPHTRKGHKGYVKNRATEVRK